MRSLLPSLILAFTLAERGLSTVADNASPSLTTQLTVSTIATVAIPDDITIPAEVEAVYRAMHKPTSDLFFVRGTGSQFWLGKTLPSGYIGPTDDAKHWPLAGGPAQDGKEHIFSSVTDPYRASLLSKAHYRSDLEVFKDVASTYGPYVDGADSNWGPPEVPSPSYRLEIHNVKTAGHTSTLQPSQLNALAGLFDEEDDQATISSDGTNTHPLLNSKRQMVMPGMATTFSTVVRSADKVSEAADLAANDTTAAPSFNTGLFARRVHSSGPGLSTEAIRFLVQTPDADKVPVLEAAGEPTTIHHEQQATDPREALDTNMQRIGAQSALEKAMHMLKFTEQAEVDRATLNGPLSTTAAYAAQSAGVNGPAITPAPFGATIEQVSGVAASLPATADDEDLATTSVAHHDKREPVQNTRDPNTNIHPNGGDVQPMSEVDDYWKSSILRAAGYPETIRLWMDVDHTSEALNAKGYSEDFTLPEWRMKQIYPTFKHDIGPHGTWTPPTPTPTGLLLEDATDGDERLRLHLQTETTDSRSETTPAPAVDLDKRARRHSTNYFSELTNEEEKATILEAAGYRETLRLYMSVADPKDAWDKNGLPASFHTPISALKQITPTHHPRAFTMLNPTQTYDGKFTISDWRSHKVHSWPPPSRELLTSSRHVTSHVFPSD